MKLLIVESATKSKTLANFLGKDFLIESCNGHIRDLPKGKMGIDIENNFEPQYVIPKKKQKTVTKIKKMAQKADTIILATDEDREGEAIAWHLEHILRSANSKSKTVSTRKEIASSLDSLAPRNDKGAAPNFQRIAFHEITKEAVKHAIKNPRGIDLNLVNAQQARRVLDRLVGFELSPLLWKKVVKGLSAGRVQSPSVRLIVEREKEIKQFKPQEYWTIEAEIQSRTTTQNYTENKFIARLNKIDGKALKKLDIKNKEQADEIVNNLKKSEYRVDDIRKKQTTKAPFPPYTTSTLQQAASRVLKFSAKQTMFIAQQLYETGLISYPRTDSLHLASAFISQTQQFITNEYGKKYACPRRFKTKSKIAQEAHEAIRPTSVLKTPEKIKTNLSGKHHRLYDLIWRQAAASQMSPTKINKTSVDILASTYMLRATGSTIQFDGWYKLYPYKLADKILPELKQNEKLDLIKIAPEQHFTEPPPRYSEATLVKTLEEYGIGRPSTYAPIISTIQTRNYVQKQKGRFSPTEMGILVTELLIKHFFNIVDYKFTAKMEDDLDKIAQGEKDYVGMIKKFYTPFKKNLMKKEKEIEKTFKDEQLEEKCPKCGKKLVIKMGRFGKFIACPGFPECRFTKNVHTKESAAEQENNKTGVKCPKCDDGEIVKKTTRKGKYFYGCPNWPKCDFALWYEPTGEKCKKCGSLLVKFGKDEKIKCSNKECK